MKTNQIFQYNGSPITFYKDDNVMVNATEMVMMQTYEPKLLIVGKNLKKTSVSFPVKGRNLC